MSAQRLPKDPAMRKPVGRSKQRGSRLENRSTEEVFEEHLALRAMNNPEDDIARNYATNVVLLSNRGLFLGIDGLRHCVSLLCDELPDARFTYTQRLCHGEMAFLRWTAESARNQVIDGVDSFVIRQGRITAQTIYYTIISSSTAAAKE
jgi:hypothetical protein